MFLSILFQGLLFRYQKTVQEIKNHYDNLILHGFPKAIIDYREELWNMVEDVGSQIGFRIRSRKERKILDGDICLDDRGCFVLIDIEKTIGEQVGVFTTRPRPECKVLLLFKPAVDPEQEDRRIA